MGLSRRYRGLLVLIFILVAYYSVFFNYILGVKDSIVDYMVSHNFTRFEVGRAVYNTTTGEWERATETIDVTGLVDIVLTLVVVFAPLLYAVRQII